MRYVGVFCGSSEGSRPEYVAAAQALGRTLAHRRVGLVYGGSSVGTMGRLADAVLESGGEVIGVIPKALIDRELAHQGLSDLRKVSTMHERKALMEQLSDGFVALPGGLGTLDEFFEILSWAQLGFHGKPCGLLNVCGYYDKLIDFLEHAVAQRFVKERNRQLIMVARHPDPLLQRMGLRAVAAD